MSSEKKTTNPNTKNRIKQKYIDIAACSFMMFHGKDFPGKRARQKFKKVFLMDKKKYELGKRVLTVDGKYKSMLSNNYKGYFLLDEGHNIIKQADGTPVFYYGQKRVVSRAIATKVIKRHDDVVTVRLLRNSVYSKKTFVHTIRLGFRNGEFYHEEIGKKKLEEMYVPSLQNKDQID
ncbi:uncharacterized protein Eint_010540 [Encephalitozoon intestinalis ATCC 50506]|uniref:Uncharacterized protein n=1 Tax=Encephalitozoon intestinalis (strain ATCC 50506) TaxID=876142 RepID=E0S5D2_ENCIT|nr:uncharacterized protein Eint_010540 [Encephalitozoon intestinalis ATCC 50506]ADM10917.2 hypothetical protein Eint_010540 [Encephalitozoon intestinalis ATCC 50506]UTX44551.1 hypothetical protein GPK93_01g00600 [Encephalitozoon intestinalis]